MRISQPFGCEKSLVISIPTEIVKLTSREAQSILSHNLEMWLLITTFYQSGVSGKFT